MSTTPAIPGQLEFEQSRRVAVDSALVPASSFADLNTVIRDTCNRFTRTTGWNLTFQRAEDELADELEERLQADEHCYWHARVLSGFSTIGLMSIVRGREQKQPDDPARVSESPFLKGRLRRLVFPLPDACDAADIIVNLINKIATRSQVLELAGAACESVGQHFTRSSQNRLDVLRFLSGCKAVALFMTDGDQLELKACSGIELDDVPHHSRSLNEQIPDQHAISANEVVPVAGENAFLPIEFEAGICVALDRRNKGLGTVWFYGTEADFSTESIEQAISLAGQFAGAFDDLAVSQIEADNSELRRELRLLAQIQRASECTDPPRDERVEFSFFSQGASEVNGDLCEHWSLDEHRTLFAIGDACGHGLPAAVITSTVRGCLRCLLQSGTTEDLSPAELLRTIGNAVNSTTPTYLFMTLVIGIVDSRTDKLRFSNAGHPAPLIIREDGSSTLLDGTGLVLGVTDDADYHNFEVDLAAGDTLIAFSDGISEARNDKKELFLSKGVLASLQDINHPDASTRELVSVVLATAKTHARDELSDDATVLVLRRR